MGGAVVIPVIMQIHTDFLCPFRTPDRTLTRRNQVLRDDDIFSKVGQKKQRNKDGRFLSFLFTFDPDTWQTSTVIFSEFNWKIVFSKITSHISKPLSVFDKLGVGSNYRGGTAFQHTEWKKCNVTGNVQIKSQRRSPSSTRREKRGDCKLAWISAVFTSRKLLLRLEETKYQADCTQYRNYYEFDRSRLSNRLLEFEYCQLKSKDRSPLAILKFTEPSM